MSEESFWAKVKKGPACWEWQGSRNPRGYGSVSWNGRLERTHRISWSLENGAIPNHLIVMHLCHNPPCVRPEHLALGTTSSNILQARQRAFGGVGPVSYCTKGHAVDEKNSLLLSNGEYQCRICRKARHAKYTLARARRNRDRNGQS
jgi:hypothetical protein